MTPDRYNELMNWNMNPNFFEASLTDEERAEGWHFCMDYDLLLVGPGMESEQDNCTCFSEN